MNLVQFKRHDGDGDVFRRGFGCSRRRPVRGPRCAGPTQPSRRPPPATGAPLRALHNRGNLTPPVATPTSRSVGGMPRTIPNRPSAAVVHTLYRHRPASTRPGLGQHASGTSRGAALLRWRPNQSLRRRRGRRQLDPSRRGEERRRVRWGLPLALARFVRGLSTHQGSGCLRRLRTAATAAKCHRAPVDSHRVADQMPTGPSMSRRRAPHAASPLPRG